MDAVPLSLRGDGSAARPQLCGHPAAPPPDLSVPPALSPRASRETPGPRVPAAFPGPSARAGTGERRHPSFPRSGTGPLQSTSATEVMAVTWKSLLLSVSLLLVPTLAQGAGVNLAWDACSPEGGVPSKTFACNTNSGSETLWASFVISAA